MGRNIGIQLARTERRDVAGHLYGIGCLAEMDMVYPLSRRAGGRQDAIDWRPYALVATAAIVTETNRIRTCSQRRVA